MSDISPGPPPELLFRRRVGIRTAVGDLWCRRELVVSLAEGNYLARYKQAVLGIGWALFTPVVLMVAFSLVFQRVADVDTGGVPYTLFAYVALVPWTFFSSCLSNGAGSLTSNSSLLNKARCPREVFPLAAVMVAAIDAVVALSVLGLLFVVEGFAPRATSVWVPVLVLVQICFCVAVALVASVLVVYLRDLRHLLPILLQVGLFVTPIAYGIESLPDRLRLPYSALNPLVPVIDGYRRTVLLGHAPRLDLLAAGAAGAIVMLVGGYALFKKMETGIADVA